MSTDEQIALRQRRRRWWLRVARRGLGQAGVAQALGMSVKSASTIGDWERGVSEPSLRQLELLAGLYGVPLTTFTEPQETDEERLDAAVRAAEEFEREDWEGEGEARPKAEDAPPGAPRIRAA